jgi:Spy/CpxP family protein refolding chaperone
MKIIKMKIHLLPAVVCGAIVAMSPVLRAQSPPAPATSGSSAPSGAPEGEKHHRGNPIEMLTKKLDLTPDQVEKIKPIFESRRSQMKALREDTTLAEQDKRAKGKEIMESTNQQIKAILTPDQATKFEELMKEMHGHHKDHGDGAQGQPAPANQ